MKRTTIVKCTGYDLTQSKGGHPQMIINLVALEESIGTGEELRSPGDEFVMFKPVVLDNDDSVTYAIDSLRLLGMTNNDITQPEGLGRLKAKCVEEFDYYNGKGSWKAKYINSPTFKNAEMGDDLRDQFAAIMADRLAQSQPVEVNDDNEIDPLA